ncbi:hypothetical protein AB0M44_18030 [Streptosporangium subroseum]|uniref:hypothetical protein n=1 Tax=Streptosporangium subroseum TaxID=106412 RepID=UPI00343A63D9
MPDLILYQRLFAPEMDVHISQTLLAKRWVQVDASLPLLHIRRADLTRKRRSELEQFIAITRGLLGRAPQQEAFLPDILDPRLTNLAFDIEDRLRLLDTNRLINTKALRRLPAGEKLDIRRRRVHAKWMRRLMLMESAFCGRHSEDFWYDPLYTRYLDRQRFDALFADSMAAGEPI